MKPFSSKVARLTVVGLLPFCLRIIALHRADYNVTLWFYVLFYGVVLFFKQRLEIQYLSYEKFKKQSFFFLVFYIVGSFLSAMSLLAQGQLVAAIWLSFL